MRATIRVLLVNQIRLLGNVLAAVLEDEPDMEVVGCATSVDEALNLASESDVILINTRMSNSAALRLIRVITDAELPAKALALGLAESKEQILKYVEAGAAGYVLKDDSVDDLLERIRGAYAGRVRVSPKIATALMSRVAEYAQLLDDVETGVSDIADLTPREEEILNLISQGLTNQEIAERLVIEVGTVKNHVHSILQKLDASSRHEAAATWAIVKEGENAGSMMLE
jgi:DNA-binding NarL/FixJ family response regulator